MARQSSRLSARDADMKRKRQEAKDESSSPPVKSRRKGRKQDVFTQDELLEESASDASSAPHGETEGANGMKRIVTKKPTVRPAGKTPYQDETIHPNTPTFLGELKKNNNRPWLKCE